MVPRVSTIDLQGQHRMSAVFNYLHLIGVAFVNNTIIVSFHFQLFISSTNPIFTFIKGDVPSGHAMSNIYNLKEYAFQR